MSKSRQQVLLRQWLNKEAPYDVFSAPASSWEKLFFFSYIQGMSVRKGLSSIKTCFLLCSAGRLFCSQSGSGYRNYPSPGVIFQMRYASKCIAHGQISLFNALHFASSRSLFCTHINNV